jgi:hypothetical protein
MKWQLRFGNGKRMLNSMLICCLWVFAIPAAASADPMFSSPTCSVQQITQGRMVQWNIKGTVSVTGLPNPPGNQSTTAKFEFQTSKDNGTTWSDMNITVSITTRASGGTANFDTSWIVIGMPAKSQQYRVVISGGYIDGNGQAVAIPGTTSPVVTPSP